MELFNLSRIKESVYIFNKSFYCFFKKREKRFFSYFTMDINDEKPLLIAHCVNTGKMEGLLIQNSKSILSCKDSGKLPYTWEAININNQWVGINTFVPNKLVEQMLNNGLIPNENFYKEKLIKDLRYKPDFSNENYIIEVKHAHLVKIENNIPIGYFPDCPTERGSRQMDALINLKKQGKRVIVIYILQRDDAEFLSISETIDPIYYEKSLEAKKYGIEFYVFNCQINKNQIEINKQISFFL
jgi:sugar fermentation stimulation protein A